MTMAMRSGNVPITRTLLTQFLLTEHGRHGYWGQSRHTAATSTTTGKPVINRAARASLPHNAIEAVHTGSVSRYTHGHHVAEIEASRGGREGDKAFSGDNSQEVNIITCL
jgi:hypothetical protein